MNLHKQESSITFPRIAACFLVIIPFSAISIGSLFADVSFPVLSCSALAALGGLATLHGQPGVIREIVRAISSTRSKK